MTIIFRNPGLIDLDAVRTMGVNVKPTAEAFGYFGTGLKFALATILHGGGTVNLWRGTEQHSFTCSSREIRGEPFNLVCMDGEPMGFTDQLGKNWEPWMVLRELGCNALDEDGLFWNADEDVEEVWTPGEENTTAFIVAWDAMDKAYEDRSSVFFNKGDRLPVAVTGKLQIAAGESDHIFYRGIRALKLERPSAFTYNVMAPMTLSEDRQIASHYYPDAVIRAFWLGCEHPDLLKTALLTGNSKYEGHLRFDSDSETPSRQFMDVVLDARDARNADLSIHAKQAVQKAIRAGAEQHYYGSSGRPSNDSLGRAIEALMDLTRDREEIDFEALQFVTVKDDDVDADKPLIFHENDRLYIKASALREPAHALALPLLLAALQTPGWPFDPTQFLAECLIERHPTVCTPRHNEVAEPAPAPLDDPTLVPADPFPNVEF